jgi:hypothetical protein
MKDLPAPSDQLALRLLERWVTVVHADTTRSLLHGRKRKVTGEQIDKTIHALRSVDDDHALRKFVARSAPRWQAQLIVTAVIDLVGTLGDVPPDDPFRVALRQQLDKRVPVARIAEHAVGRRRT